MRCLGPLLLWLPAAAGAQDATSGAPAPDAGADAGPNLGAVASLVDTVFLKMAQEANAECVRAAERKEYARALAACRRAHDAAPRDPEIASNFAYLQHLLGNVAEARRLYRLTLRLAPGRKDALLRLARLLTRTGASAAELKEAGQVLVRARERGGNDPRVVLEQARLAARQGRVGDAERLYIERLDLDVADDALYLELGDFYRDRGRPDDALRWYRRVQDPDGPLQRAAKRIRDIEIERRARAYGWKRPTRAIPEQATTLRTQARAALGQGQLQEAARMLEAAVQTAPLFAAAHADLAEVHQAGGDTKRAGLAYLRALVLDAGNADVLARLAALHTQLQRTAEAVWCLLHRGHRADRSMA